MNRIRSFFEGGAFKSVSLTLAVVIGLVACSSPAPVDGATEEEVPFNDNGTIFAPASPQTYAELGVASWIAGNGGIIGLDQEDRIKSSFRFPTESGMEFYGEERLDLPAFSEGTTAAKTLERAGADLAKKDQQNADVQTQSVTSSLSPLKNGSPGASDGTGCTPVQGIGVRGTPMTKMVCPGAPAPAKWDGCTGADGKCPVSGLICRSCSQPEPPAPAPAPSEPKEPNCTVRAEGPSDGAGTTLVRECEGDDDDQPNAGPQLVVPPAALNSRQCTTPPSCEQTLTNYYSNKALLAGCKTAESCAYWDNMVKSDLPWLNDTGCSKCFGGR